MALTIHHWTSSGDKSFGNSANWDTGAVPSTSGDVAFFGDGSQVDVDGSDQGAADFILRRSPKYTGKIGSSASPLRWDNVTPAIHVLRGPGETHVQLDTPSLEFRSGFVIDHPDAKLFSYGSRPPTYIIRGLLHRATGDSASNLLPTFLLGPQARMTDDGLTSHGVPVVFDGSIVASALFGGGGVDPLWNFYSGGRVELNAGGGGKSIIGPTARVIVAAKQDLNATVWYVAGVLDVEGATITIGGVPTPPDIVILPGGRLIGSMADVDPRIVDLNRDYPVVE